MPKYTEDKVGGYYLYFTSECIVEAMHVHASNRSLTQKGSAKFWVNHDGSSTVQKKGRLSDKSIRIIKKYIQANYKSMYEKWRKFGGTDQFYN